MKKLLLVFLSCFLLWTCTDYLDIKPYGKTIPKTAEEFSALLNTLLNKIDYGSTNYIVNSPSEQITFEMYADNLEASITEYPGGSSLPIYVGSHVDMNSKDYENFYSVIRDCNVIIGEMKDKESAIGRQVMGVSYAVRGICYYELLRRYCNPYEDGNSTLLGVPLVKTFDMNEKPIRSSYSAVVSAIEEDLLKSLEYGVNDDIYRFTKDVINGYLARLYFWTHQWQKAIDYSSGIIKNYPLVGIEEYKTMMQSALAKKGNIIFKSYIYSTSSDLVNTGAIKSMKDRPVSVRFIRLFDDNDIRKDLCFNSKRETTKFPLSGIRTAEILLIRAEAYAHLNQNELALEDVNSLLSNRIKNFIPFTMSTLPTKTDAGELIKVDCRGKELSPLMILILKERRKELFNEGDRWFELKRNGRPEFWSAKDGKKYITQKFLYTFPLPIVDVELVDGLIQNEGYEIVY